MPKLLPLITNEESSVYSSSLCRKLSLDSNKKKVSPVKVDRLGWGEQPTHLDNYLSNRHQMFRGVLKPMSPVSFKNNNDNGLKLHKTKANRSPYLMHLKSLREKELFLLKMGLINDTSSIDDSNLKKELTIQSQLESIVSPIKVKKSSKKTGNNVNRREQSTSNSSLWSCDSTIDSNISTRSLHADTLSYLVANSSNQWWRNERADSSGFSVNSANTACSGGSEYGVFEAELVSLNGDDELISNDSDSIRH